MQEHDKNPDRIGRLNQGDHQAFKAIFKQYYRALYHFAHGLIQDKWEAEDIVEETFLKLWKLRTNFDTEQNIKAFLFITVRNTCFNFLAKIKRRRKANKDIYYLEGYLTDTDLDHMIDWKIVGKEMLSELCKDAIRKLPPKMRTIIEFILQDFSTKQISAQMNVSEATVRVQKSRAIRAIKLVINGRNPFGSETATC